MKDIVIVWFRRDFRLEDNTALHRAIEYCEEHDARWVGVFQLDPHFTQAIDSHHDYFFQTVKQFQERCLDMKLPFQVVYGEAVDVFKKVTNELKEVKAVFFNRDDVGYGAKRDEKVREWLESEGIESHDFQDYHLHTGEEVKKDDGTMYKVFSTYYKQWSKQKKPEVVKIDGEMLKKYARSFNEELDEKSSEEFSSLLSQCDREWQGIGEENARKRAEGFVSDRLKDYDNNRDLPYVVGTSRLSPYLKTGCLSIRTLYHLVAEKDNTGVEAYLQELAWRDFYGMVHYHFPTLREEEFHSKYRDLPWNNNDEERLQKWKEGKTGFPIVDAGMRQLNNEGWMHNRLRMITASFLTKDYMIDWRLGDQHFEMKLIDHDESSNAGGWQWAASTGTDAVPYFRVFNPTTQGERFDPDGTFIKKYVEELRDVPSAYIHNPSKMSHEEQVESNCMIGKDYPEPSVDHKEQRKKVLAVYKELS
ncbi:cryptochrome/photolyase family protein [Alkalihalobacillus sp. CinArs1]|uniref:cryptochrome/photolyase family protein n=1 Tax=Alkalihalobacillus sp. CinArs1 TaxID=2995314 RepID=UPI0022DD38C6|nr:deoxyribodipyrimidine photo-lyase [Alkalihalobacillus sp. CinArs1]